MSKTVGHPLGQVIEVRESQVFELGAYLTANEVD